MARPSIDFGNAADDYARHRPGFPAAFYERVAAYGVGRPGQRVLDLGCGTGTLARGFAQRGGTVVGLDPSPEMLQQAVLLANEEGVRVDYLRGCAEHVGLVDAGFDVVCAGQCWHWFDRPLAAAETRRLLRSGGTVVVAYFSYLSDPGTVGHFSEALLLRYFPTWPAAGSDGRQPFVAGELTAAGLTHIDTFEFDLDIEMSHAAWRGRMRACNGVLLLPPQQAVDFDNEHAELLAQHYSEPLRVAHRVWAVVARRP